MTFRRSSSIGSPLVSAIRKAAYRPSWAASPRALTPMEFALLNELSPRALPEAMRAPSGFSAMVISSGCLATSGDLAVRIIFSISDGQRLAKKLWESSRLPVCRLLEMERQGLVIGVTDRKTGEIGRIGVQLSLVSTLLVISQRVATPKLEPLSAGYLANRSKERNAAIAAMNLCGGRTPE